jgi:O-antigen/teichoic acid export membrane protein
MKADKKNTLLRSVLTGSLIFYALSGLTSLLNYVYYPAIARLVDTGTYGEIQFLMSLFMQLSVGFVVLNILSIVITAKYTVDHERQKALQALNTVATVTILIIISIGSVVLAFSKGSFGFDSIVPVLMLSLSLLINVPFTITLGRLQGEQKFAFSGVVGALSAFFKLICSLAFVAMGFGTSGAIAGIAAGLLISMLIAKAYEGRLKKPGLSSLQKRSLKSVVDMYVQRFAHLRSERGLLLASLLAMGILTVLSTADVFISKLFLSAHEAGQYAAVATIAKVILYATTPLMWLALPLALANLPHTMAKVRKYVLLTASIGVVLFIPFALMPSFIVSNLLGIQAGDYLDMLGIASFAMIVLSLAFIMVAVDLCRDRLATTALASLGALGGFIVGIAAFQQGNIVHGAIIGQITAGLIAIIVSIVGNRIHEKKSRLTAR